MSQNDPPVALPDFLDWLRVQTENSWARIPPPTLRQFQRRRVGGTAWRPGTRWLSDLTDPEIDVVREKWGLPFPKDYRLFLRRLHAPDRSMFAARFEGDRLAETESPSFFNWRADTDAIRTALHWPLEGLVFDLEHNDLWFDEWGPRPTDKAQAARKLAELTGGAPPLVPVIGHRYLVEADLPWGYVVLSVYQSDIIVYARDLRSLLLSELHDLLNIGGFRPGAVSEREWRAALRIPFWGRFLHE